MPEAAERALSALTFTDDDDDDDYDYDYCDWIPASDERTKYYDDESIQLIFEWKLHGADWEEENEIIERDIERQRDLDIEDEPGYYFDRDKGVHPYARLHITHDKAGNRFQLLDSEEELTFGPAEDVQYVSLLQKMKNSENIQYHHSWEDNLSELWKLKGEDFPLLFQYHLEEMLSECITGQEFNAIYCEEVKASIYVLQNYKPKMKNRDIQKLFKRILGREFKLLTEYRIKKAIKRAVDMDCECDGDKELAAKMIRACYEKDQKASKMFIPRGEFLKLKLEKATELGIIKYNLPWLESGEESPPSRSETSD